MRQALSAMRLHLFDQEVGRFFGALAELQTAQPDVLDLSSPYLSRNIAKFRSAVSGVESEMGAALRRRIMLMRSAEESMALLAGALPGEARKAGLPPLSSESAAEPLNWLHVRAGAPPAHRLSAARRARLPAGPVVCRAGR